MPSDSIINLGFLLLTMFISLSMLASFLAITCLAKELFWDKSQ